MKAVVQRVLSGSVTVGGELVSSIGPGLVCYVGVSRDDSAEDADYIMRKIVGLRLWGDDQTGRKWDLSVVQKGFEVLLVSQFTLFATIKGNKADFHLAMAAEQSQPFFDEFVSQVRQAYKPEAVKTGRFGAYMKVDTSVDGPVTILLDSRDRSGRSGSEASHAISVIPEEAPQGNL